jgi:hypothetical protein
VVTIGGVALSAVFTLFLIPVIYTKLDRFALASRAERAEADRAGFGRGEMAPVPGD